MPPELARSGTPFVSYAAAAGIAAETALDERGPDAALAALEDMWVHARNERLPALARFLAALRISFLADAMRPGEAERAWRDARLPNTPDAILDLRGQSWREFEALGCARVRLLVAQGAFDPARSLCRRLADVAAGGNLTRTAMRAVALSVSLEQQAGRRSAAIRRLGAFLRLFAATDYARPLVRERRTVLPAAADFHRRHDGTPRGRAVATLLPAARARPRSCGASTPTATPRSPRHSGSPATASATTSEPFSRRSACATGATPCAARAHSGCCPSRTDAPNPAAPAPARRVPHDPAPPAHRRPADAHRVGTERLAPTTPVRPGRRRRPPV